MKANMSNPIIPHASQSLERDEYKLQNLINSLARKMIRKDARGREKKKIYYIHHNDLWIIPE